MQCLQCGGQLGWDESVYCKACRQARNCQAVAQVLRELGRLLREAGRIRLAEARRGTSCTSFPVYCDGSMTMSAQLREARGQALRWRCCALALLAGMPGAAGHTVDQLRKVIGLEDLEAQLGLVVRTCTTCGAEHTGTGSACDDCQGGG